MKITKPRTNSGMVGVRLGSLRPRMEAICEQRGIDLSKFVRLALEHEMAAAMDDQEKRALSCLLVKFLKQMDELVKKEEVAAV